MKKIFLIGVLFCSLSIIPQNSEGPLCNYKAPLDLPKDQEKQGWLLADKYAAQMRQNCNHVLLSYIIPLLEKDILTESEKYKLGMILKTYEVMKCSDESLYKLSSYGCENNNHQEKKEDKK